MDHRPYDGSPWSCHPAVTGIHHETRNCYAGVRSSVVLGVRLQVGKWLPDIGPDCVKNGYYEQVVVVASMSGLAFGGIHGD